MMNKIVDLILFLDHRFEIPKKKKTKMNEKKNETKRKCYVNREMKRVSTIFYLNHDFRFSGRRTINHFHRR